MLEHKTGESVVGSHEWTFHELPSFRHDHSGAYVLSLSLIAFLCVGFIFRQAFVHMTSAQAAPVLYPKIKKLGLLSS